MCPKCEILVCRKCETLHSESSFIAHSLLDHYDRGGRGSSTALITKSQKVCRGDWRIAVGALLIPDYIKKAEAWIHLGWSLSLHNLNAASATAAVTLFILTICSRYTFTHLTSIKSVSRNCVSAIKNRKWFQKLQRVLFFPSRNQDYHIELRKRKQVLNAEHYNCL